ncbi:helix-turn-helix domain-containing protein [Rhodococcus globerulus]|uniref:helix-turn-helix domain-containing protein n=1 Tax=Rhodococcus globerulus TaxID=33008 RepID=UPI001F21E355|nr:helix-turn-helix domain-containing protein [Rhodococcus globerulus]MCE4268564.1 hypothetical protein [Rhodococcus globerulus]
MNDVLERQLETTMTTSKARVAVDRIEHLRSVRQLHEQKKWSQTRLAEANGVSQPAISQWLKMARIDAPDVRPGTDGGTAYEILARYAANLLTRETMLEQLSAWLYARDEQATVGEGDVPPLNLSGFNLQVGRALDERFIDENDYDSILEAVAD